MARCAWPVASAPRWRPTSSATARSPTPTPSPTALKDLFREHKLDRRVRIGVANQRIVVRTLDLPPIEDRKELEAAVRFSAQDELPMPLDEAVIDFHAVGIVETEDGPRQRVVLVAARRVMIEHVVAAVRAAGLSPQGIDLSAFAMVRALGDGDPAPTMFLSVGGLTNLAIAEGGTVKFTRVSGSGIEGMAGILAERRGIPVEEARLLLQTVGLSGPIEPGAEEEAGMARSVLTEGVRRIAAEARASLDFHRSSQDSAAPVERVVVTGAAVAVDGFVEALEDELGLPVTPGVVPRPGSRRTAPVTPWPPAWPSRRRRHEGRQPDPARPARRRRPVRPLRCRGLRAARRARPARRPRDRVGARRQVGQRQEDRAGQRPRPRPPSSRPAPASSSPTSASASCTPAASRRSARLPAAASTGRTRCARSRASCPRTSG